MKCRGCGQETRDTVLGDWCDNCGGVVIRKTDVGIDLLFRHVCTLDGAGGRFPVVYDYSTADYSMAYPRRIKEFIEEKGEWKQRTKIFTNHGDLDTVIAMGQPIAKGEGTENPELSVAPSATPEEKGLVL